jgi:malonate-semialdehyde dehydrogenase (acetylating) / methylmalonate-semialdehyde dehydrogenase
MPKSILHNIGSHQVEGGLGRTSAVFNLVTSEQTGIVALASSAELKQAMIRLPWP